MSDWWARKLAGGQQPPQQRQSTPAVPQAIPPHQRPMAPVPQEYAPEGVVTHQAPPPAQQPAGPEAENLSEALQTKTYDRVPQQAKALNNTGGQCPDCHSGNFFRGSANSAGHCYDCGYPIVQAGSGMGALGGAGIIATGGQHAARSPQYTQQIGS